MELIRRYRWPIIGAGLVVLIVGFLLFRPDKLFVDDVVEETLADAFAGPAAPTIASPTPPSQPSDVVTNAPSGTEGPGEPPPTTPQATSTPPASDAPTTTPEPAGPIARTTGSFFGIDHAAEGTATIYEQDNRYVLRFEDDTDIQNGPDLYVWVLESADYAGGDPGDYIDLGKIKGNVGGQNYELPGEFDPDVHRFVLVWCLRFAVPFAGAPLA